MKKLRSKTGEGEATQRPAVAETIIPRDQGPGTQGGVSVAGSGSWDYPAEAEIRRCLFGWSWNQEIQPLSKMHYRQRKMGKIFLAFPFLPPSSVIAGLPMGSTQPEVST